MQLSKEQFEGKYKQAKANRNRSEADSVVENTGLDERET